VDRLTLRHESLGGHEPGVGPRGYHYDYQKELLPFEELVRISGRVEELCRAYGVQLSNQLSFGGELGAQFREAYERGRREAAADLAARAAPRYERRTGSAAPGVAPAVVPGPSARTRARGRRLARDGRSGGGAIRAPRVAAAAGRESTAAEAAVHLPICTEPWTTLYVLRRGVLPAATAASPSRPCRSSPGVERSHRAGHPPRLRADASTLLL